jgi:class 3 adenylate cyclase
MTAETCTACGSQNEDQARFCNTCGAALIGDAPDTRRIVTVVFSDIKDSTVLAQQLDPESLRQMMSRYFAAMQSAVERHGGTVEKFIGDAVMAVFGVPVVHEDDALRAVRAALEMRDRLRELNTEFQQRFGATLVARTGVETGEVVAGDPRRGQAFVAGDAVNTAARLEQAAQPGEILLGEATHQLVAHVVQAVRVAPLPLKGKAGRVPALSLLDVDPHASLWTRNLESPLVDRDAELRRLQEIFGRTVHHRSSQLVTVLGAAGVGKSRLIGEFLAGAKPHATVITGRCLPYGEGITFWPIVELLRDAAGIGERDSPDDAAHKLAALLPAGGDAGVIGERLAPLLGLAPARPSIQETFWALRKLFELLAERVPLVVVFDDIQWGEPTFLDLLEYVVDWIQHAPVLVLCLARPELLEIRPGWAAGKPRATLMRVEPLRRADTDRLIENLVGRQDLGADVQSRIAEVTEGNPLFVEEMLRMLVDDGVLRRRGAGWTVASDVSRVAVPLTIHALLTARLDRLTPEEGAVIQRASVIGREFWWEEIWELSPPALRGRLPQVLQSLTRKELIEPNLSQAAQEDTFRFTHILIRDAAYGGIPKAERASLHQRFAEWIERSAPDHAGEYEEIRGYHLEQAYVQLRSLGPPNERMEDLQRTASETLAAVGGRAFARGDMPAAANLLARSASLLRPRSRERAEVLLQLAFALLETGDFGRLEGVLAETTEAAVSSGDRGLQTHAAIVRLWMRLSTDPEGWADEARVEAEDAIAAFESTGDERGLARGWSLLGLVYNMNARFGPAEEAWSNAAAHARAAGDHRDELESLSWIPLMVLAGPTHVDPGLARCEAVLRAAGGDRKAMASALTAQAVFLAGSNRLVEAREAIGRARALLEEMGLAVWLAGPHAQFAGWLELLADDPQAAEAHLRSGYRRLEEMGEVGWLSTVAGLLAEAVCEQGRNDEAAGLAQLSAQSAGTEDIYSQVLWRTVLAKVHARRGEHAEADRLAADARALADTTDFLLLRWHAALSRAEVQRLGGDGDAAETSISDAIELAREKGNVLAEQRARVALGELGSAAG